MKTEDPATLNEQMKKMILHLQRIISTRENEVRRMRHEIRELKTEVAQLRHQARHNG